MLTNSGIYIITKALLSYIIHHGGLGCTKFYNRRSEHPAVIISRFSEITILPL